MKHFNADIIIIGAGITGLVASLRFKQFGYSICMLEKNSFFKHKPGESLNPNTKNYLSQLKINFNQEVAVEYNGHAIQWGSNKTAFSEFIFNPYGNGLCVNRSKIENYLKGISEASGNLIFLNSTISAYIFKNKTWDIQFSQGNIPYLLRGKLIIFATGRNIPKNFGIKPHGYFDKLLSLSVVTNNPLETTIRSLLIESMPNGWMYSNHLPDNKRVITLFTDNDLIGSDRFQMFFKNYYSSQLFNSYMQKLKIDGGISINCFDSRTYFNNSQFGDGWLLLGDCAYAIDPLSGEGILKNFSMIDFIVNNIKEIIAGKKDIFESYYTFNKLNFNNYLIEKVNTYSFERRWLSEPFWSRRCKY